MIDVQKHRFDELLKGFQHALLVMQSVDGHLRCRPMAIAEISADNVIWFITSLNASKVTDVLANPKVCVLLRDSERTLSISGFATMVHDRARIRRFWNEKWRTWFPAGSEDASIVLLRVHPIAGEFWDQEKLTGSTLSFTETPPQQMGNIPRQHRRSFGRLPLSPLGKRDATDS